MTLKHMSVRLQCQCISQHYGYCNQLLSVPTMVKVLDKTKSIMVYQQLLLVMLLLETNSYQSLNDIPHQVTSVRFSLHEMISYISSK